jgi:hypothetical protein
VSTDYICKACGTQGGTERRSPSNLGVEIVVWLAALLLAAVTHWVLVLGALWFTLWRFTGRHRACGECDSREVIPLSSPLGQQLAEQMKPKTGEASTAA